MPGPMVGVVVRYVVTKGAATIGKAVLKQYGKRTARQRMVQEASMRGGVALSPAPQGPYTMGHYLIESSGGEHAGSSGTPGTARQTSRGRSAQTRKARKVRSQRAVRDEKLVGYR